MAKSKSKSKGKSGQAGSKIEYEFMGPPGAFFIMSTLPLTCYALYFLCTSSDCLRLVPFHVPELPSMDSFLEVAHSQDATLVVLGYFAFQALIHLILPGKYHKGVKLADGSQLSYKCNGLLCFIVTLVTWAVLVHQGHISGTYVYDNLVQLLTGSIILSWGLSILMYVMSLFYDESKLAPGGNTGNFIYDFFIGRPLNPRIGGLDFKFFCELRPGLTGWVLINLSMAFKQYQDLGYVTKNMALVNVFQFIYVIDSVIMEPAILTTMDIVHDGFGFMLVFGDLAWVPFTYSLQSRYLADRHINYTWVQAAGVLAVDLLGYYIFRASNAQKNAFRTNPNDPAVRHLKTIKTERGTQLLITGWWGIARHINYFGDWLMGVAWCLPCAFESPIPYFYAIYFAILLIHRELRDEHNCQKKYGKDWDKYCSIVKYKIIPYVY